jgi:hypothetical protein
MQQREDQMTRIVSLLNEKNHYLEKFYSVNESELVNFVQGQFDNLEPFYQTRERILDVIKYIDSELEKVDLQGPLLGNERLVVKDSMRIKDEYVSRIIEQDIQVLSCIEMAKNSIIKELQDLRRNKKAVGSYKSKTFHNRLDEEV